MQINNVIIIDDESPARSLLKDYIKDFESLRLVAECQNGIEAIEKVNLLKPDLIFLDIQMPGKNGFEVLQDIEHSPKIIFSTALDDFAIKAFEVNAVDYLLKPYTKERFSRAVNKTLGTSSTEQNYKQKLVETFTKEIYPTKFLVESGNKSIYIATDQITWIEAFGDYIKIHTEARSFIYNKSMFSIIENLDPLKFQRVHRSSIVALTKIKEIRRELTGVQIVLQNDFKIKVSRSYFQNLKKWH